VNQYIAIVDPYSAGSLLADAIRKKHVGCIAVRTGETAPKVFRKNTEKAVFDGVLIDNPRVARMLRRLCGRRLTHVVAGCESGVKLADQLSEELGLPSNGTRLSLARRDKFLMSETVRAYGLDTADVFQSPSISDVAAWATARNAWPVIVKPVCSVASDNIHLCDSKEEVLRAATKILDKRNSLDLINKTVLAQEYLHGTEYIVDTVSLDGRHKVTAYWAYHRSTAEFSRIGYDSMTLLPFEGELQESLRRYTFEVLNSLGVRFGPAHTEVMWCDGKPILVETGARLTTGLNAVLSGMCGGICQLDETVDVMLAPDRFLDFGKDKLALARRAANVFLVRKREGRLVKVLREADLRRLKTLYRLSLSVNPGEMLPSILGTVTLMHESIEAITEDMSKIREIEENGLFELVVD
jgi:hypothetical protein